MKRASLKLFTKALLLACLFSAFSCKKIMDIEPEDKVDAVNHYRNINDANAAVIGIYGQLMSIADRYIVLNELRADLMSPTINADQYLREISTHTATEANPWADPKPFYRIIINCNDALKNFDMMLKDAKIRQEDYDQRYADVNAVRAWLYLQLGIHWGEVPYVTDAVETTDALKDASKFPKLKFNDLLDKLILSMQNRFLDNYSAAATVTGSTSTSLNTTVDGYPTNLFFVNKRCLLGDLYLWRGRYTEASTMYRYVTETGYRNQQGAGDLSFWQYKPNYSRFLITYTRAGDEASFIDDNLNGVGWRAMFGSVTQGTDITSEWIWSLPFDKNFNPVDPFIDLFSNQGGKYLLTASKYAIDRWNSVTQSNGFPYDGRGRLSVKTVGGQPVIMKHLYYYLDNATYIPVNILQKQGRWLLYRAGTLNLHFAEAAARDNQVKVAFALTNVGIKTVFNGQFPGTGTVPTDRTNLQRVLEPAPYDLDGREGEVPYFRSPWYRQIGTRSRANLPQLPNELWQNNDVIGMENAIIDEDGSELAFEGQRWSDLLRVALRRNDASFIASKVYEKLSRDGNPQAGAAQAKLSSFNGVYLPFKL